MKHSTDSRVQNTQGMVLEFKEPFKALEVTPHLPKHANLASLHHFLVLRVDPESIGAQH